MAKRILSGVQATGNLHIGNYLGAIKPWVAWQDKGEAFYFIPNLHSLNTQPKAEQLLKDTYDNVAWLLAAGIDPKRSAIFAQSEVSAHSELCWILNNFVTMGELNRMTQYKDKSQRFGGAGQYVGLFEYPVLMAADILLYDATTVPVGLDQKQHVELARDIATRFNNQLGAVLTVPEASLPEHAAEVKSLQNPEKKMSKSDPDEIGKLNLLDDEATMRKKLQKAVTDSGDSIEYSKERPALANLLEIFAAVTGKKPQVIASEYAGKGYGEFKSALADAVVQELLPLQLRYKEFAHDQNSLREVLTTGSDKAKQLANSKLQQVKDKLGLL